MCLGDGERAVRLAKDLDLMRLPVLNAGRPPDGRGHRARVGRERGLAVDALIDAKGLLQKRWRWTLAHGR